jgi:predicted O-linked N-acetylglucosamine transferase (SPINDLY family)
MDLAATMQEALRLHQTGRRVDAEALYRDILAAEPGYAPALFFCGFLETQTGRRGGLDRMARALSLYSSNPMLWVNYAVALRDDGQREAAEEAAQRAVALAPNFADGQLCLGDLLLAGDRPSEAEAHYRMAIAASPDSGAAYLALGRALNALRRPEESIGVLERAAALASDAQREEVMCELGHSLTLQNRTAEAIAVYEEMPSGAAIGPAQWRAAICLPVIYRDHEDIAQWRRRYGQNLALLETRIAGNLDPRSLAASAASLTEITNFWLPYQGENDKELQLALGRIIARIVGARFPDFVAPLPPRPRRDRPRVGFVSHFWREHSIAKTHGAWITGLDRRRFETFVVQTGSRDAVTEHIARNCDHFFHHPVMGERLFAFIKSLDLDVLIYPDLGMQPEYQIMAALRLGRIQCNGLGHPVTSGFTAIDVALSSALMEPDDAAAHYSERLVVLPNTGFSYRRPETPVAAGTFDRGTAGPVFVCAQNLYKLLPSQDRAFARVAAAVPEGVLWFIQQGGAGAVADFTERLSLAMRREGADPGRQLRILPQLDHARFLRMYRAADIYLDGHHWSGCNTTYEALSAGLPVVTWPGTMMRARHSAAILRAAGLGDLIAQDEDSYVALACRLARNPEWRATIRRRVVDKASIIFNDPAPIADLADFIEQSIISLEKRSIETEGGITRSDLC